MLIIVDKLIEGFQLKFKSWQISQKRLCESEREAIYEIHENLSEKSSESRYQKVRFRMPIKIYRDERLIE